MATKLCDRCRREHPDRQCDYDPETGRCSEVNFKLVDFEKYSRDEGQVKKEDKDGNPIQ